MHGPTPTHAPVQRELFGGVPESAETKRLSGQLARVWEVMRDREWHLSFEVAELADVGLQSIGPRIRDLRKSQFGGHDVKCEHVGGGVHRYRIAKE